MSQEELRQQVGQSVRRFIAAVVLHNQAVAARVGLGASDAQVLSLLTVNGPMTPGEIAKLTGLTTGSVTTLLDRLELGTYIHRARDTRDRRKVVVAAAPEGQDQLAPHFEQYGLHLGVILAQLTGEQLETINAFFTAMNEVDGYIAPPPAPRR